jgi:hypothetical protein
MAAGGTPGEEGGTRQATAEDVESVDPATQAYIHILRGCGLSYRDITDELGLGTPRTPRSIIDDTSERIADGADPIDVWEDVTEVLYANDPEAGDGN